MPARAITLRQAGAPSPAWQTACDALVGGCDFLIARGQFVPSAIVGKPLIALRRAGNCLNELDRLLSIVLDEGARLQGMDASERPAFERSRDTPRKLRRLDALRGTAGAETQRLQAIARLRRIACGDLCGIPRAMVARDLATATDGLANSTRAGDTALVLSDEALARIAQFYRAIAQRLAVEHAGDGPVMRANRAKVLDFSTDKPHLSLANVACDGI